MDIKQIKITTQRAIPLGYQGENAVVQIVFPQPENLLSEQWALMHQRATDGEAYPVPLEVNGDSLIWTVSSGDTAVSGLGRAQLICTGADGEILKTMIYGTVVAKSLAVGGDVPDPVKPWYDAIMAEIENIGGLDPEDIKAAVDAYMSENPSEAPVQSVNGQTGTVVLDIPTDDHINSLIDQALEGGSSGEQGTGLWTLIREHTIVENVREYSITEDADGGAFAYDELMLTVYQDNTLDSSGKLYFHFNGVQCGSPVTGVSNTRRAIMFTAARDGMITASWATGANVSETAGGLDNAPSGSTLRMYFSPIVSVQKLESAKLSTSWWDGVNLQAGLIVRLWGRNK